MAKTNTNPEVRFAGFTEDWKEKELSKILNERKVMQKITEDAPILAFAAGQGVIDRSERKSNNRDHLTHDQENKIYKLTELNDIVYNPSNLKYGAIDRNKHGRGVISPIYVTFTTEEEPSFVELLVKNEKFKLRALQYEEGTVVKRQSVKPENLLSLKVNISPSKDEQKKIGKYFEDLENLIKILENKYLKLLALKKAMLNKMFPAIGRDKPEMRFACCRDAWEEIKLSDIITNFIVPMRDKPKEFSGSIPWTRIEDIEGKYINDSLSKQYVSTETIKKMNLKVIPKGSLIVSASATFGVVAITTKDLITNQTFIGLVPKPNNDLNFLYTLFKSPSIQAKLKLASAGSTIFYIPRQIFEDLKLFYPKPKEQKLIGDFFHSLDSSINLYEKQHKKLQNIKQACFEKITSATSKHFEFNK